MRGQGRRRGASGTGKRGAAELVIRAAMGQARILVGQIGQAHGLKGEVKLASFTEEPCDIARYGTLETEAGRRLRSRARGRKRAGSSRASKGSTTAARPKA